MASDKRLDQVKLVNSAESVLVVNGDQVEKATLAGFANSMGSSVPLQQTSEQVSITGLYARTSDGKMVELTKESVASVMAGLMNTNKLFPFMDRGYLKGSANDLYGKNKAGIYTVSYYNEPNFSDLPEGVSYGTLSVLADSSFSTQILSSVTNTSYYIRYRSDTAWGAWQRIDNFGYNTLAELSSGVAEQIKPLCIKAGQGLDFNGDFAANTVYQIGNLESQTSNAPFNSNSSCLLFRTLNTGIVVDLLIGIEQPFMYGRYNKGSWNKIL